MGKRVKIMETVVRDGQQSLIATRMPIEDMLPILEVMDSVGYESVEMWGGATFDSCIRFLDEDPWERLRTIRKAMPNTQLQMLLRGQNILGYRHYADDVVDYFVQKAIENGIEGTELLNDGVHAIDCITDSHCGSLFILSLKFTPEVLGLVSHKSG